MSPIQNNSQGGSASTIGSSANVPTIPRETTRTHRGTTAFSRGPSKEATTRDAFRDATGVLGQEVTVPGPHYNDALGQGFKREDEWLYSRIQWDLFSRMPDTLVLSRARCVREGARAHLAAMTIYFLSIFVITFITSHIAEELDNLNAAHHQDATNGTLTLRQDVRDAVRGLTLKRWICICFEALVGIVLMTIVSQITHLRWQDASVVLVLGIYTPVATLMMGHFCGFAGAAVYLLKLTAAQIVKGGLWAYLGAALVSLRNDARYDKMRNDKASACARMSRALHQLNWAVVLEVFWFVVQAWLFIDQVGVLHEARNAGILQRVMFSVPSIPVKFYAISFGIGLLMASQLCASSMQLGDLPQACRLFPGEKVLVLKLNFQNADRPTEANLFDTKNFTVAKEEVEADKKEDAKGETSVKMPTLDDDIMYVGETRGLLERNSEDAGRGFDENILEEHPEFYEYGVIIGYDFDQTYPFIVETGEELSGFRRARFARCELRAEYSREEMTHGARSLQWLRDTKGGRFNARRVAIFKNWLRRQQLFTEFMTLEQNGNEPSTLMEIIRGNVRYNIWTEGGSLAKWYKQWNGRFQKFVKKNPPPMSEKGEAADGVDETVEAILKNKYAMGRVLQMACARIQPLLGADEPEQIPAFRLQIGLSSFVLLTMVLGFFVGRPEAALYKM